jgi:hypothetical protein
MAIARYRSIPFGEVVIGTLNDGRASKSTDGG